ncbi:hypothetical protein ACWGJW_02565 [Streptomyces nigrescens]
MSEAINPFAGFTNDQLEIINDMFEEWCDKDRHGELERERNYDLEMQNDYYGMSEALHKERKKRRLTYF